jgi:hypothetical protein
MSYRPNEQFVPKQQRKQYVSAVYCCDKNLEQRISITFCVKIGNSASETLGLLTLAYGEYAVKKWSNFEWHKRYRGGEKMCRLNQEAKKRKGHTSKAAIASQLA